MMRRVRTAEKGKTPSKTDCIQQWRWRGIGVGRTPKILHVASTTNVIIWIVLPYTTYKLRPGDRNISALTSIRIRTPISPTSRHEPAYRVLIRRMTLRRWITHNELIPTATNANVVIMPAVLASFEEMIARQ